MSRNLFTVFREVKLSPLPLTAYFCMEFGLDASCKLYAGGLGILAGDILKAAADSAAPLIGIGIKWSEGYTDQKIGADGKPYDNFSTQNFPALEDTGTSVSVVVHGVAVRCKIWRTTAYGNAPLYLLDPVLEHGESFFPTRQLYGGPASDRIVQEVILGVGGVKAIRALNLPVEVFHFNEGHAAFAGFELIREKMDSGSSFEAAWSEVRKSIVFTTHTPIAAGNEVHDFSQVMESGGTCGLSPQQVAEVGGAPFGMSVAALRLSHRANAVSELHGETARAMWKEIQPAAPIINITNGVHRGTWVAKPFLNSTLSAEEVWTFHQGEKQKLGDYLADHIGFSIEPEHLVLGFARRSTGYKRANLFFHDLRRVEQFFADGRLKIVFAGKAHPKDQAGKELIASLVQYSRDFPKSVAYIPGYDIDIGRLLTRGVDVWLNNPFRPLEACGTSGMKAAMNGVLNLSVLDGWWPEVCRHGVNGWAIGSATDDSDWDRRYDNDAASLYSILENDVIPTYYNDRDRWMRMMLASIESTRERYSADTMLRRYFSDLYCP